MASLASTASHRGRRPWWLAPRAAALALVLVAWPGHTHAQGTAHGKKSRTKVGVDRSLAGDDDPLAGWNTQQGETAPASPPPTPTTEPSRAEPVRGQPPGESTAAERPGASEDSAAAARPRGGGESTADDSESGNADAEDTKPVAQKAHPAPAASRRKSPTTIAKVTPPRPTPDQEWGSLLGE